MSDIVEFLRARYAEDAATARAAGDEDGMSWAGWQLGGQLEEAGWDYPEAGNREAHVLRHDPAAVLADIDAKLRLLNAHDRPHECIELTGKGDRSVVDGEPWELWEPDHTVDAERPCFVVRTLASGFATHPDYREEWTP